MGVSRQVFPASVERTCALFSNLSQPTAYTSSGITHQRRPRYRGHMLNTPLLYG
jgi:hypothetical protein